MTTHPGLFAIYCIWDSINSHHSLQHSAAYGPFIQPIIPLLAGDISIAHLEITDRENLKEALESPVTQMSHLAIRKGKAAEFLKAYYQNFDKHIVGEKYKGMWLGYSYEDP